MNIIDGAVQFVKKNDSKLLLGASLILGGVTIVSTIKSTRKVEPILTEHNEKLTKIHMAADTGVMVNEETKESYQYSEKEMRKDIFVTYACTTGKLAKLYKLPIAAGLGALGCNLASHKLLSDKNLGLQAALTGAAQSFNNYRNYISDKYGKEVDTEAMYGIKQVKKKGKSNDEETPTYMPVDSNKGMIFSSHSRLLDEASGSRIWNRERQSVLNAVISIEQSALRKLKYRKSHTMSLNELLDMIDLDPAEDGNVMGWIFKPGDPLDENGLPAMRILEYWLINNNGQYVKKDIKEEFDHPTSFDPALLIDFANLVYIG